MRSAFREDEGQAGRFGAGVTLRNRRNDGRIRAVREEFGGTLGETFEVEVVTGELGDFFGGIRIVDAIFGDRNAVNAGRRSGSGERFDDEATVEIGRRERDATVERRRNEGEARVASGKPSSVATPENEAGRAVRVKERADDVLTSDASPRSSSQLETRVSPPAREPIAPQTPNGDLPEATQRGPSDGNEPSGFGE